MTNDYFFLDDAVNFDGPVEPVKSTFTSERGSNRYVCPTINGLVVECLAELRRFTCSLARSDMVSGLNAMLKDVLPVSLVTNLRLEGKTSQTHFVTFSFTVMCKS